ncbi:inhibitor of apoptosis protein-like [Myripristis murdjan]|uniref:inhibitor of apoptosis protein-like n=1 Tax=Myripristis murdjan TaxID=586833 RepID=UPI00117615D1|nr:inhibitor of apoptosis protein-like [Myripristis murdjan]
MSERELARLRLALVERLSTPLIKDLLNDLLAERVFSNEERDSVMENRSRAGQVRLLVDMVRNKGDAASQILLGYLRTRDPTLHRFLFPPAEQEPAAADL